MKKKLLIAFVGLFTAHWSVAQEPDTSWVRGLANDSFNKSDDAALWDGANQQDQEYLFGKPSDQDKKSLDDARAGFNDEELLSEAGRKYTADLSQNNGDSPFQSGYGLFESSLQSADGIITIDSYGCEIIRTPNSEMLYVPDAPIGQRIKFDGQRTEGDKGCQPSFIDAFGATCELQTDQVSCQQFDNSRVVKGNVSAYSVFQDKYFTWSNTKLNEVPSCGDTFTYEADNNMLINGSFEQPGAYGSIYYPNNIVPGWNSVSRGRIEMWRNRTVAAAHGNTIVELNENGDNNGIYQDVTGFVPGQTYRIKLMHRALKWNGETLDVRVQNSSNQNIAVAKDNSYSNFGRSVTNRWTEHTATFVATETSHRIYILATNPGSGKHGNLLDHVRLYPEYCRKVPQITVTSSVAKQELSPLFNGDNQNNVCWIAGVDAVCTKDARQRNAELESIANMIGARTGVDQKFLELFGACEEATIENSETLNLGFDNAQRCSTAVDPTFNACMLSRNVTFEPDSLKIATNEWVGSDRCERVIENLPSYQSSCSFDLDQVTSDCLVVDGKEVCSCEKFEEETGEEISTCEEGYIGVTPEMAARLDHFTNDDIGMCAPVEEGLEAQYLPGDNDCVNGTLQAGLYSSCTLDEPEPAPEITPVPQYGCQSGYTLNTSTNQCELQEFRQCPSGWQPGMGGGFGLPGAPVGSCLGDQSYSTQGAALNAARSRNPDGASTFEMVFSNPRRWKPIAWIQYCPSGTTLSPHGNYCVRNTAPRIITGYSCPAPNSSAWFSWTNSYRYVSATHSCELTVKRPAKGPHCPVGEPSGLVDMQTQWDDPMACIHTPESADINMLMPKKTMEILLASNDDDFNAYVASQAEGEDYSPPSIFCRPDYYPYTYKGEDWCVGSELIEPLATCAPYEEIKATSPAWGVSNDKVVTTLNVGQITCERYDEPVCDDAGNCFNQAEFPYTCNQLESDSTCRLSEVESAEQMEHPLGIFTAFEDRVYSCRVEADIEDNYTEDVLDCGDSGLFRCIEDNCFEFDREADPGFAEAMARLAIVNSLPDDMVCSDPDDMNTCQFFGGREFDCSYGVGIARLLYGCCPGKEALLNPFSGIYSAAEVMTKSLEMVYDRVEKNVVDASGYVGAVGQGGTQLATSNAKAFLKINQAILDAVPGWLVNQCDSGASLIMDHAKNEPDVEVMHYGGSYCSERIRLGFTDVCVSRRQHYCVYNTPFAKIVMDAAAPQYDIHRRKGRSSDFMDCRGITIEEVRTLDWSNVNTDKLVVMMARTNNLPPFNTDFNFGVQDMNVNEFKDRADYEVPGGW
ncbi:conjugal transfer protein TraN [Marinobacter alkaliphilus]|uniref:Conjugal transfer protein TraN n=1 Tax=Marinobacter alkaliphilus TaxID=254719 RepID=A0ABZ3E9C7_9GAMM